MEYALTSLVAIMVLPGVITFVNEKEFVPEGSSRVTDYLASPLTWPGHLLEMLSKGHLENFFCELVVAVAIIYLQVHLFPEWVIWPARIAVLFVLYVILFALNAFAPDLIGSSKRKRQAEARARRAHAKP